MLNGSVYTSLGSLYYQVPGWPIGFGSDKKAESYLKKALAVNPDGMDPNYFYGDFMLQEKKNYSEERVLFHVACALVYRANGFSRLAGQEIKAALAKVKLAMQ